MVVALVGLDRHEDAVQVARTAKIVADAVFGVPERPEALTWAASALSAAGQPEDAEDCVAEITEIASPITDEYPGLDVLVLVAITLADARLPEPALAVARMIGDPRQSSATLAQVALALVNVGQYRQAEKIGRSIADPTGQADALAEIADALVEAGQLQSAEDLAHSIGDSAGRAESLARLAVTLADAGSLPAARRLTAVACATAHWAIAAAPALILHDGAFAIISRALDGDSS
jgi:tetratricopeptide (TPR) repeat protein